MHNTRTGIHNYLFRSASQKANAILPRAVSSFHWLPLSDLRTSLQAL